MRRREGPVRILWLMLLVLAAAASHALQQTELPAGRLVGGVVEDGGRAVMLLAGDRGDPRDGSRLVVLEEAETEIVELPGFGGDSLTPLAASGVVLQGRRMLPPGAKADWGQAMEIVQPGSDEKRTWAWRDWDFWVTRGMHFEYLHDVSRDGLLWGAVGTGTADSFDRAQASRTRELRVESVVLGSERPETEEWLVPPAPIILRSDGPVVLIPWNCWGAYIVHFAQGGGVDRIAPIFFDNGVVEHEFRWQASEDVLWVRTPLYWKAYHLPGLALSGEAVAPYWVLERSVLPHPERGIVRFVQEGDRYRIEHAYRDPESSIRERHVSDWQGPSRVDGDLTPGESLPRLVAPPHRWARQGEALAFTSPNGRHAVVVEQQSATEGVRPYARRVPLRTSTPRPPVETDAQAERAAEAPKYYLDLLDPIAFRADRPLRFVFGSVAEGVRRQGSPEELP